MNIWKSRKNFQFLSDLLILWSVYFLVPFYEVKIYFRSEIYHNNNDSNLNIFACINNFIRTKLVQVWLYRISGKKIRNFSGQFFRKIRLINKPIEKFWLFPRQNRLFVKLQKPLRLRDQTTTSRRKFILPLQTVRKVVLLAKLIRHPLS